VWRRRHETKVTNVWERKFPFNISHGNESSRERRFLGTKVPPMELSFLGTKVPWYESSSYRHNDVDLEAVRPVSIISIQYDMI